MRYAITTLGCKVNQYDSSQVASHLRRLGLLPAAHGEAADLLVINTCCVTATGMAKSRHAIRRALRRSPAAVLVTGCYADYARQAVMDLLISQAPAGTLFAVADRQDDLPARVRELLDSTPPAEEIFRGPAQDRSADRAGRQGNDRWMSAVASSLDAAASDPHGDITSLSDPAVKPKARTPWYEPVDRFEGHQRAFVKVQDGCDAFCAYCIVPFLRRQVAWRPVGEVVGECRRLVEAGHREIVLSGVFLGAYGRPTALRRRWDNRPGPLGELIAAVAAVPGLWRVRLSSLEPLDLTDELLEICRRLPTFAPHFHLPLQSGSERILRRMNRQYTAEQFGRTVERLRGAMARPAITTDVIVGFPGESDEDFAATLEVARQAGFAKIHAFPFSPIRPTAAWRLRREQPPPAVVRGRMADLARLERELATAYRLPFVGQTMEALVEAPAACGTAARGCDSCGTPALDCDSCGPAAPGCAPSAAACPRALQAMTDRYLTVTFLAPPATCGTAAPGCASSVATPDSWTGKVVTVKIAAVTDDGLDGTLLPSGQ